MGIVQRVGEAQISENIQRKQKLHIQKCDMCVVSSRCISADRPLGCSNRVKPLYLPWRSDRIFLHHFALLAPSQSKKVIHRITEWTLQS